MISSKKWKVVAGVVVSLMMFLPAAHAQTHTTPEDLARHFFPQQIWFHHSESCSWPATTESSGVAVYRVREHPDNATMLSVTYSILYRDDCGGIFGIDRHPGDVESFSYTLVPDAACPVGWRLFEAKATAHGGEPRNVEVKIVNSCEPLPELFVSRNKHGTYLTVDKCNAYIDPTQRCERGFTAGFTLVNAGNPEQPQADDLSAYFPSEPGAPTEYIWSGDGRFCGGRWVEDRDECVGSPGSRLTDDSLLAPARQARTVLIGLGDSLTHGTMDATNNALNTVNAYFQKVGDSLGEEIPLGMSQPFFDLQENRLAPFRVPTNLGVDGADIFSVEGLEYYKRVGASESVTSDDLLADRLLPRNLKDKYDKVLYPINLLAGQPVSEIDSAIWLLNEGLPLAGIDNAVLIFWAGNNDSALSALGAGGRNPQFQPIPLDLVYPELNPILRLLFLFGLRNGEVSFQPYTQAAIERNLTRLDDFTDQYVHVVDRVLDETASSGVATELFLPTLPYYSAVGYLMDSEDLEFYLRKLDPEYTVPATFKRVAPPGEPIVDPLRGDRVSLLTFGFMYALLSTGHPAEEVNRALEVNGQQRDGLVLSEVEQQYIMTRIDGFNALIKDAAASSGPNVHLVDIGQYLNDTFAGKTVIEVDGRVIGRKWMRGGGFSFDGVHPGYTGQAMVANFILEEMNAALGLNAAQYDLSEIMLTDPYVDWDGDGWAAGPNYEASRFTELLFLFKDPNDSNPEIQVDMPSDVWDVISRVLLEEILGMPLIRAEAERLGAVHPTTGSPPE